MATIHDRRRHDKWMVPSVIGMIIMLMVQFGGIVWWGSNVNSKANTAYTYVQANTSMPSRLASLELCDERMQEIPVRVMRLEEETDELQDLPSSIASLNAKFESLNTWIVEMRRDQRELTDSIDSLHQLIMDHYRITED